VLLETLQKKPFGAILQEQILDPLGMADSFPSITNQIRSRLARGYQSMYDDRPGHTSHPLVPANWLETGSGDGCVVSTAADMAKFGRMLLKHGQGPNGRIISEESFALMTQEGVPGEEYGLGCFTFEEEDCWIIGHGGDMPGYESMLILDETNQLGLIFLSTTPYPSGLSFGLQFEISRYRMGKPLGGFPEPKNPLQIINAEDFQGAYRMDNREFQIDAGEDCLSLIFEDQIVLLESRGKDAFYANLSGFDRFLLRFGRNAEGHVVEAFYGGERYLHPRYEGLLKYDVPDAWHTYTGHYRTTSPWLNENNFRIVIRKDQLLQIKPHGDEAVLIPLGNDSFRVGEEEFIPEVIRFEHSVDGKMLTANISGWDFHRFFTP
jgi:hypothetical protein